MKEQFVPYQIALKVRELGFDERVLAFYQIEVAEDCPILVDDNKEYRDTGFRTCSNSDTPEQYTGAPLWQQIQQWLLDTHNTTFTITPDISSGFREIQRTYFVHIHKFEVNSNVSTIALREGKKLIAFNKWENAREAAIIEILNLIELTPKRHE